MVMELGAIKMMPRIERGPQEGRFHSGPPPPPPPRLKTNHPGGSKIHFGSLICVPVSGRRSLCTFYHSFRTPPPSIKGKMDEGVRNPILTVDLSARSRVVQMRISIIIDSGPPPPPPGLKAEWSGGSGMLCTP
jgi:hypothetical protein